MTARITASKEYFPAPKIIGIGPMKIMRPDEAETPPVNPAMSMRIMPRNIKRKPIIRRFVGKR